MRSNAARPTESASSADLGFAFRSFHGKRGGAEHFITVAAASTATFREQLQLVRQKYAEARRILGLSPETAVFRRIFLSDAANQAAEVRGSELACDSHGIPVAVSIVQQAPLNGAKLALLAYHVDSSEGVEKWRIGPKHLIVTKNGLRYLWSTQLCAADDRGGSTPEAQTRSVFGDLIGSLEDMGSSLRDHCVRTWIYLKDVDVFYQGMVDARRTLFTQAGLTADTHFIASTGIQGACAHRHDLVMMDAYSLPDLIPSQISYLNDFGRLCPTHAYNVTFERGTRVAYADRAHYFISGTASIDRTGQVLHPGDVLRQLSHALSNVEALLRSGSAHLDDMMYLLVYLRDPADFMAVDNYLRRRFADLPFLIVHGPVCRPNWLVEVEGVGIAHNEDKALPAY